MKSTNLALRVKLVLLFYLLKKRKISFNLPIRLSCHNRCYRLFLSTTNK